MTRMTKRIIIQIMPAPDWFVVIKFDDIDGEAQPDLWAPLICWALCWNEDDKYHEVVGMEGSDYPEFCDEGGNSIEYRHASERREIDARAAAAAK